MSVFVKLGTTRARLNSSSSIVSCSPLSPPPPYSFGYVGLSQPFSASVTCFSRQNQYCSSLRSSLSTGARMSSGTFAASQSRTSFLNSSCSSVYR